MDGTKNLDKTILFARVQNEKQNFIYIYILYPRECISTVGTERKYILVLKPSTQKPGGLKGK